MKVSERSWHLRLARFIRGRDYVPRDLCSYFWGGLVFSALIVLAMATALLFLVGFFGFVFYRVVVAVIDAILQDPLQALVLSVGSLLLSGILFALLKWRDRWRRGPRPPAAPPNPVVEYLRAKKRRVCPLIEVTPDDRC